MTVIYICLYLNLSLLCKNLETTSFVGPQPVLSVHLDLETGMKIESL